MHERTLPDVRIALIPILLIVGLVVAVQLSNTVFRPPPASERLAGVTVAVTGHTISDLPNDHHLLRVSLRVTSVSDVDECLGFTLDSPFGNRRLKDPPSGCVKPRAGATAADVAFDQLTDDDLTFPAHTLVWGISGGRCGPIYEAMGLCVVEQAGSVAIEFPQKSVVPTFRFNGTFAPLFSFEPLYP
jgi:hypothetical protein